MKVLMSKMLSIFSKNAPINTLPLHLHFNNLLLKCKCKGGDGMNALEKYFLENNIITNKQAEEIGVKRHVLALLVQKR